MGTQLVNTPTISAEMLGVRYRPGIIRTLKRGDGGSQQLMIRAQILDELQLDAR